MMDEEEPPKKKQKTTNDEIEMVLQVTDEINALTMEEYSFQEGLEWYWKDCYGKALQLFEKAPSYPPAVLMRQILTSSKQIKDNNPCKQYEEYFMEYAMTGNPISQYHYALYLDAIGNSRSAEWTQKSAEQQYPPAQHLLGEYYQNQLEYEDAVVWFLKAAEHKFAKSEFCLAFAYRYGDGVNRDTQKAVEWLHKAAEHGYPKAQEILADCYESEIGVEKNHEKAMELFTKAAEQGSVGAIYTLAELLRKDSRLGEAMSWYEKGAELGCAASQHKLGVVYMGGVGVTPDLEKSFHWMQQAASNGHSGAQTSLGSSYYYGHNGVKKDVRQAVFWLQKAAERGRRIAQNTLGICYDRGVGVRRDIPLAVSLYKKAAKHGLETAQYNLAQCFHSGTGVRKSINRAVKWYRKSAEQGYSKAQYEIGMCYEHGEGLPQNHKKAVKWVKKAADQKLRKARRTLRQWKEAYKPEKCSKEE